MMSHILNECRCTDVQQMQFSASAAGPQLHKVICSVCPKRFTTSSSSLFNFCFSSSCKLLSKVKDSYMKLPNACQVSTIQSPSIQSKDIRAGQPHKSLCAALFTELFINCLARVNSSTHMQYIYCILPSGPTLETDCAQSDWTLSEHMPRLGTFMANLIDLTVL